MTDNWIDENGYKFWRGFGMDDEGAKECAKHLRDMGYRARVKSEKTCVKGIRHYSVWYKVKESVIREMRGVTG